MCHRMDTGLCVKSMFTKVLIPTDLSWPPPQREDRRVPGVREVVLFHARTGGPLPDDEAASADGGVGAEAGYPCRGDDRGYDETPAKNTWCSGQNRRRPYRDGRRTGTAPKSLLREHRGNRAPTTRIHVLVIPRSGMAADCSFHGCWHRLTFLCRRPVAHPGGACGWRDGLLRHRVGASGCRA